MKFQEILTHRKRDFDSVTKSKNKIRIGIYVLLRQFIKIFGFNEEKIKRIIPNGESRLWDFRFFTRKKTLDFLFASKYYEPETTRFIMNNKGKLFLDIGAHIGRFALLASKSFEKVYAIEPHPLNLQSLKKNVSGNNLKNIDVFNFAASNSSGKAHMKNLSLNTGAAQIVKNGEITIQSKKIDDLLKEKKQSYLDVNLVLIDVEGHELKVLEGAKHLLTKGRPKLIIESFELKELNKFLEGFGYKLKEILDHYNYLYIKG